jgi:3-methyladenine DNA glycosylase AlkD
MTQKFRGTVAFMSANESKFVTEITKTLERLGNAKTATAAARFFKCREGEYGAGDKFLGITNPMVRKLALEVVKTDRKKVVLANVKQDSKRSTINDKDSKESSMVTIPVAAALAQSPYNEQRFFALLMLIHLYSRKSATESDKQAVFASYMDLATRQLVNNWNLVDLSAPNIVGDYYLRIATKAAERRELFRLAASSNLWLRRIAVIAMLAFVRSSELDLPLKMCAAVLKDDHDLMHKACGWVLQEIGKKDPAALAKFLENHAAEMPRTALRYSIERMPVSERQKFMAVGRNGKRARE